VTTDSPKSCNIGLTKHVIEWTNGGSWIAECPRDGSLGVYQGGTDVPAPNRPAYDDPDYARAATPEEVAQLAEESGCDPAGGMASAGWDISLDARINYGRDLDGNLSVQLHLGPDYDGSGAVRRTITPAQLVEHAWHLLLVAKGEIEADKRLIISCAICTLNAAISSCAATARNVDMANETKEN
jgi:hypothetical protein